MGSTVQYTRDDKRILFFVALVWGADMLYYLKAVVMRLPVINTMADYFVPVVIIISLLITLGSLTKRLKLSDYFFYLGCVVLYLLTFVLFPANDKWLEMFLPMVFFQTLPYFFIGLLIEPQKQLKVIEYVSMVSIVLSLIYLYSTFSTREVEGEEMGVAYSLLPHLLIVLNSCFRNFKWYSLLIFILGFLRLLGTGNRGTLVCLAFYVIVFLLFCSHAKYKWVVVSLLSALTVFVLFKHEVIFGLLSDFLGGLGFNTRVFDMALNDEFVNANGRDTLSIFFTDKIGTGSIFGYGIMGDRTLLNMENGYPHNLALEFLIDFGVPLGGSLLMALVSILLFAFKYSKTPEAKSMLVVFVTVGFVSLFISDSYLANPMFFLLIGYAVQIIRNNRKKCAK